MKLMKTLAITLILAAGSTMTAPAGDGVLDLTRLANYANQAKPAYITKNNTTPGNAITDRGATLGRILFHDKRLSRNNTISCSSCHVQSRAFGDLPTASSGVAGTTGRHSMRLINTRFANEVRFFWDERATTLENQTTQPVRDHVEMGFSGTLGDPAFTELITKLSAIDDYRVLFTVAFGSPTITEARIQMSLAQFVRSIQSFDSKFDAGMTFNPQFGNFSAGEERGRQLFLNPQPPPPPPGAPPGPAGAGCAACHAPPEFDIDPRSLNNGVITKIGGGTDLTNTRSPSLRDLIGPGGQSNGGLMHDASLPSIAAVINHYNQIPGDNANLDQRLRRPGGVQNLNLSQPQKDDLAAFLATLTGTTVYTDTRWSDPFTVAGELSLIILPADEVTITPNGNGTASIACHGVPGLVYHLQQSADLKNWTEAAAITADANGVCSQLVGVGTKAYYRYAYVTP